MKTNTPTTLYKEILVVAGIRERTLFVTEKLAANRYKLGSPESTMYFQYKKKYPTFSEVIVPNFDLIPFDPKVA